MSQQMSQPMSQPISQQMSQPFDAAAASAAYRNALSVIEAVEPTVVGAIRSELADQRDSLKLIASENYASPAVLLAMGTWLSDKYAEGTFGHRFYAGCQYIDTVEQAAADHAREVFGAPHAYVRNAGWLASARATAFAAMTCPSGPPSTIGQPRSTESANSGWQSTNPPRGPRNDLCVVVVVTCAWGTGSKLPVKTFPATRPAKWAMSTISTAPTSSAISRIFAKSIFRGLA
jgi:hypothetical protein